MGEVGCWCVTFFALLGLVVVEAVQNSPCWLKVGRKGVFRACRESFVPGGAAGLRAGRVLYRHRPWIRYKVLPAWLVIGVSAKKFSQRTKNAPKMAFYGLPGELFRGSAQEGGLPGELFRE